MRLVKPYLMSLLAFLLLATIAAPSFATVADLNWIAPTENIDGTPLTNLDGFYIYYAHQPEGPWEQIYEVTASSDTTASVTFAVVPPLGTGISPLYFSMKAYNTEGKMSVRSNVIERMFSIVDPNAQPGAPVIVDVLITINCPPGFVCNINP